MMTIVAGTNRPKSASRILARELLDIYRARKLSVQLLDLATLPPEIFSPRSYIEKPPAFHRWSSTIVNATALLFVVPEYNGGVAGALKYFIDMLPMPASFESKPIGYIGVGETTGAASRAVEQVQHIASDRNAYVFRNAVLVRRDTIGANGIAISADVRARLEQQADAFCDFAQVLAHAAPRPRGAREFSRTCDAVEATD